jgi:hypothetical protein
MKKLPENVSTAWENRKDAIVFSTISKEGIPNSIYATCVSKYSDSIMIVANNFFSKTMANIQSGSMGSILFITNEDKSFQIKGTLKYDIEDEFYQDMKKWNPARLPGYGAAVLEITEVYSGAEKLI